MLDDSGHSKSIDYVVILHNCSDLHLRDAGIFIGLRWAMRYVQTEVQLVNHESVQNTLQLAVYFDLLQLQ